MTSDSTLLVQLFDPSGLWIDVGHLSRQADRSWFSSFESYWASHPRPVLGQRFEERGRDWRPSANVALPTWFSHLLPEGRLRGEIAREAGVNAKREALLIEWIGGDDLPGALRLIPADAADGDPTGEDAHDGAPTKQGPSPLKFSLAGVQVKFSVNQNAKGLTLPASGEAGHFIAKFPDPRPAYRLVPEAEFAGLELARKSGIRTADAYLAPTTDVSGLPAWAHETPGNALIVKRFDRDGLTGRVHIEEFAQVLDVPSNVESAKYTRANCETFAKVAAAFGGPSAALEVIDRIVLNVLLGNGDAHSKNWALRYPDGRNPELSPAYDIVPTVLFVPKDDLGVKLNGSKSFDDVRVSSFDRLGAVAGLSSLDTRDRCRHAIERVIQAWPVLKDCLGRDAFDRLTARRDELALLSS